MSHFKTKLQPHIKALTPGDVWQIIYYGINHVRGVWH